jgi:hypothetical protein
LSSGTPRQAQNRGWITRRGKTGEKVRGREGASERESREREGGWRGDIETHSSCLVAYVRDIDTMEIYLQR